MSIKRTKSKKSLKLYQGVDSGDAPSQSDLDAATHFLKGHIPLPDSENVRHYFSCGVKGSGSHVGTIYFTKRFISYVGKRKWKNAYIKVFRPADIIDIIPMENMVRILTQDKKYIFYNFNTGQMEKCLKILKRVVYGLSGNTPLHNAISQKKFDEITSILDQNISALTYFNMRDQSPLQLAVTMNNMTIVSLLLEYYTKDPSLDINLQDEKGMNTVLHTACSHPNINFEIISRLLEFELIDVNRPNAGGNTPLHYFCEKTQALDCTKIGDLLVSSGADVNSINSIGETPMHKAVLNPSVKLLLVDFLTSHESNLNYCNDAIGDTPLHYSVRLARFDLVEKLVAAGADISIENHDSKTPKDIAVDLYGDSNIPVERKTLKDIKILLENIERLKTILEGQHLGDVVPKFVSECLYEPRVLITLTADMLGAPPLNLKIGQAIKLIDEFQELFKDNITPDKPKSQDLEIEKLLGDKLASLPNFDRSEMRQEFFKDNDLELDFHDLEFTTKIGSGSSGLVFKGIYKQELEVAIKVLNAQQNFDEEVDEFKKELAVLVAVDSPYVVKLFGATLDPHLCMVMEYCSEGNLYKMLQTDIIDWNTGVRFLEDAAKGLQALHDKNIVHRDLKSLNLLITSDFHVKVCDFGLSRDAGSNLDTFKKLCGTYGYCAPEVFNGELCTTKSDVFSYGIIVWEVVNYLVTGSYSEPYSEFEFSFDFQIIVQTAKGLRPNIPPGSPKDLVNLYLVCINPDPDDRPNADEIADQIEGCRENYEEDPEAFKADHYDHDIQFSLILDDSPDETPMKKIRQEYLRARKISAKQLRLKKNKITLMKKTASVI
eukprot:TRINITY_DN12751_c0_g1_i1.p1 TRINITY_DN12751_c0_g1~~TRINITY_DN12751_c0_g1_i1.p1  ORF type:complete len:830 (-),score=176.81 TRINITY_DN12751_c0_g1_i1:44-2533(-)